MKKQGFLFGSVILVASVIITKIIGICFKIPLANILGGTGMGYFGSAYAIFMPIYAFSVTGLPAAISRMVAENIAFERYANVRKIRRVAILCFSVVGLSTGLILLIVAGPFTKHVIQNEQAYPALLAIAPCIFFGAVMSVYRGYFEGMRNMFPTAISQIIEAVAKIAAGLGLASFAFSYFEKKYFETGMVLNVACDTIEKAHIEAIPYISAAAILGVTLSSAIGCIYLVLRYHIAGDGITKEMLMKDKSTDRMRFLLKDLVRLVIPIALGSFITTLTSVIDLGTIIRYLKTAINIEPQLFMKLYENVIDDTTTLKMLPNFIYGSFTGLALTVFNLVPSLTSMFGKGILPNLAEAWSIQNYEKIKKNVHSVIFVTGLIAIPSGFGITALSKPILNFLYSSRIDEVSASSLPLSILGVGVIMLSLSIPVFAMLQAIGRSDLPVKIMLFGIFIKLIGNIILIPIPHINIVGAAISTSACYTVICVMSLYSLLKITGVKLEINRLFIKPTFAAILCAVTAFLCYDLIEARLQSKLSLLIAITAGGFIYILCLLLLDITSKKRLKSLIIK